MPEEFKLKIAGDVRVRIAPSPTGHFHIGNARTALFNYLFAKKNNGSFVLRIEDTDKERSKPEYAEDIIEELKWLGLNWTEGPDIGGKYGPYKQSERLNIYRRYLEGLLKENKAYRCFCTEDELESQRQYHYSQGEAPRYSGKCSQLSKEEIEKCLKEGKPWVLRFRSKAKKIVFEDMVRGRVEFDSGLIGDMVIAKDLDTPLYNFAVVIDDFEMKISHVIRGDDHLSNTPKQILMQEALGIPQPQYAHLPMILGEDRSKMSKRHGDTSVLSYRKAGYLPETLVNFMAFLGWNPGDEREIFSLPALVKEFSFEKVQKAGAIFNSQRLDFLNGFYIRQKSNEKLAELCAPYLIEAGLIRKEDVLSAELSKIISLYKERLKKLSEITDLADFFFKDKLVYEKDLLKWKTMIYPEIKDSLSLSEKILSGINKKDWTKENIENILMAEAEKSGDRGRILWPLRVALSGKKASAGPFEIAEILGKEKTIKRISEACSFLD